MTKSVSFIGSQGLFRAILSQPSPEAYSSSLNLSGKEKRVHVFFHKSTALVLLLGYGVGRVPSNFHRFFVNPMRVRCDSFFSRGCLRTSECILLLCALARIPAFSFG
jgi:hypothetical protein